MKMPILLFNGILVSAIGWLFYKVARDEIVYYQADKIYREVHQTFPSICRVKFTNEVKNICRSTTLLNNPR